MNTTKIFTYSITVLMFSHINVLAETYYVSLNGNDNNSGKGLSSDKAWFSINHACNQLRSGDTLFVDDGEYFVNKIRLQSLLATEADPTVIQSINPWGAQVRLLGNPEWGNIIEMFQCGYIEIDGFEVYAVAPHRSTGIQASENSHHVTIRNCFVHDCGCGGISGRGSDYITIENNVTMHNATRSEYNCSGISIYLPEYHDKEPGYHMIIRGNVTFKNECTLPFTPGGFDTPTDGNGIILDLFKNPYNSTDEGQAGGYYAETLIENNLSFGNGGRGINIYHSDNVTVRNNTLWHNNHVLAEYGQWKGDLEGYESQNQHWYNNIVIKDNNLITQGMRAYEIGTTGSDVMNNIVVGEKDFWPDTPIEKENIIKDGSEQSFLQFNNPTTSITFNSREEFANYFGLQDSSPAVNRGLSSKASETDINGISRTVGAADIGCYEYPWKVDIKDPSFDPYEVDIKHISSIHKLIVSYANTYRIDIYGIDGRLKKQWGNMLGKNTLQTNDLPKGVYLVQLKSDVKSYTTKIQVQ